MSTFLIFLTLTLALEAPVFFTLLKHRSWRQRIAFWLAANIYSYPAVYFFFPYLDLSPHVCEALAEIWAPCCEIAVGYFILPQFSRQEAMVVVAANLFSWAAGTALILLL